MLVRDGAKVSLIARSEDKLRDAVAALGDNARFQVADVGEKDQLVAALDAAEAAFGPIEGLFANAGTGGTFAPMLDYTEENYHALLAVNLHSVFHAIQRVLPGMYRTRARRDPGHRQPASERGMANNVAYVVSKHGVLGMARAVALEAAPHGVRVNCIVPGFIETPLLEGIGPEVAKMLAARVPQGRIGAAEEVAEVAAFLLSDAASHVTGQSWSVDGGVLGH